VDDITLARDLHALPLDALQPLDGVSNVVAQGSPLLGTAGGGVCSCIA
jgi:hypothetical protein